MLPNTIKYQFSLAIAYYEDNQTDLMEATLRYIITYHPLPVIRKEMRNIQQNTLNEETIKFIQHSFKLMLEENF